MSENMSTGLPDMLSRNNPDFKRHNTIFKITNLDNILYPVGFHSEKLIIVCFIFIYFLKKGN